MGSPCGLHFSESRKMIIETVQENLPGFPAHTLSSRRGKDMLLKLERLNMTTCQVYYLTGSAWVPHAACIFRNPEK